MKRNKDFILGCLFVSGVIPILSNFVQLLTQYVDYLCAKITVKAAKLQEELPQEEERTFAYGFQAPDPELEEEYDEGE